MFGPKKVLISLVSVVAVAFSLAPHAAAAEGDIVFYEGAQTNCDPDIYKCNDLLLEIDLATGEVSLHKGSVTSCRAHAPIGELTYVVECELVHARAQLRVKLAPNGRLLLSLSKKSPTQTEVARTITGVLSPVTAS